MYPFTLLLVICGIKSTASFKVGVVVHQGVNVQSVSRVVEQTAHAWCHFPSQTTSEVHLKWVFLNSTGAGHVAKEVCEIQNEGIDLLVTMLRYPQRKVVSALAEILHIPHLALDLDLSPTPRLISAGRLLADIYVEAGLKKVALLFDKTPAVRLKQSILVQLSLSGIQSALIKLPADISADWSWIPNHIVVIAQSARVKTIVDQLQASGSRWQRNYCVLLLLEEDTAVGETEKEIMDYKNINIVLVKPKSSLPTVALDPPCMEKLTFSESLLAKVVHRLYRTISQAGDTRTAPLNDTCCSVTKERPSLWGVGKVGELKADDRHRSGYDLYGVLAGHRRRFTPIAHWTVHRGLIFHKDKHRIFDELFLAPQRDSFNGVTLRIVVHADSHPYVSRSHSGSQSHHGIAIEMLDDLADKLNFRYSLMESKDGVYGNDLRNGSWSGMIGMVVRGEVDMGVSSFTVTLERSKVVDFTTPFMLDSLGILTPLPQEKVDLFQVFKPFSLDIWLTVLGCLLLTCLVIFCLNFWMNTETNRTKRAARQDLSFHENILLVISLFCQQGLTFHPTSVSARCFLTFWCVFTVLISAFYTANLAAVLTVSTPARPINTLQDLADQTDFGILVTAGTSTWEMFNEPHRPLYERIGKRMSTLGSSAEIMDAVTSRQACFIGDHGYLQSMMASHCGGSRVADEQSHGFPIAFILPKRSPFKQAIDNKIQKMVESGLIQRWQQKWLAREVNCTEQTSEGGAISLGLKRVGGVVILYTVFAMVTGAILLLERSVNKVIKPYTICCERYH